MLPGQLVSFERGEGLFIELQICQHFVALQGILMLQDHYRAIMQYSIPKELCPSSEKAPSLKASADWFCIKVS